MDIEKVRSAVDKFSSGKYEVVDFLCSGAFADVYIIRHLFLDDLRVLKIVKSSLSSESIINNILQEVRIISPLNHENIISIHDAGIFTVDSQERIYFIMEYNPGGDLYRYLCSFINSDMSVPIFWTLDLIKQLCFGLNVLHASSPSIIHGDLNLNNILIGFNSQDRVVFKLSDFGFAKILSGENKKFPIAGTKPFMAPECFKKEFYPSTDIYSLGVIFYICLTNHFPYNVNKYTLSEICEGKPWNEDLILPSYYNNDVSEQLDEIVIKCLSYDYENRFRDAKDLFDSLGDVFKIYSGYDESHMLINSIKKALRLAKYENKKSEAMEILDEYDLSFLLDDENEETADKTLSLENISDILDWRGKIQNE